MNNIFHYVMKIGSLVMLKLTDRLGSQNLGVVISLIKDCIVCTVMWSTKGGAIRAQEHLKTALLEVDGVNNTKIERRYCISI